MIQKGLIMHRVNLDSTRADVEVDGTAITITAETWPNGDFQGGYLYRAHVKLDPNNTWRENVHRSARSWELAQRDSSLWEVARGDDYNYCHRPWEMRPSIELLVGALQGEGHTQLARRVADAFGIKF